MAVVLLARVDGDVEQLTAAYDTAHRMIGESGGAPGELRHHCAIGDGALYIIGVWESEQRRRTRFASAEFRDTLSRAGFPPPDTWDIKVLELHAIGPPL